MKQIYIIVFVLAMLVTGVAFAAKPTTIPNKNWITEQARTQFIQFVDKPLSVSYDKFGDAFVNLSPSSTGIFLPLTGFREICVEIVPVSPPRGTGSTKSFDLTMGKLSGITLGENTFENQPTTDKIYCSDVKGPEASITLHGSPNSNDSVELWVNLRS